MSRLESNAEPSMEEILASIRKIIAEDSSGMRAPATPPRPGTPYSPSSRPVAPQSTPSPAPQRGFMSREAFLKSSQPEPELPKDAIAPVSPRSASSRLDNPAPSSRLQPREETSSFGRPSPTFRERDIGPAREPLRSKDELRSREPQLSPSAKEAAPQVEREASPSTGPAATRADAVPTDDNTIETVSLETVEVVAVEDALPVVDAQAPAVLKVESGAIAKSDAQSIEAQLSELLSEDLNALRQGRPKAEEPKPASAKAADDDKSPAESSDPFAFDLGPSPFAAKAEPARPVSAAPQSPVSEPAPSQPPLAAAPAVEPTRPAPPIEASFAEISPATNGAPYVPPFEPVISKPSASAPRPGTAYGSISPDAARPPKSEPEAPASRFQQPFAIPSVSGTLGPTRKLEPLSNAFQPAPPPPPSALETFSPAAEASPSSPSGSSQRPAEPPVSSGGHDETVLHSSLPATTSDMAHDRAMEDAVADLLRPLLKTWLAENMPKIVERALRREMSERLLPGQKSPHE
ncbi:MAG: DUF2497 domain-containing protein [Hyphomicrobium sp.]|uniref:DUF2497 domain-containing protein n=1 Tax=Hyphomicrobium sp. TaxID=82 RepID=UPI0039E254E6